MLLDQQIGCAPNVDVRDHLAHLAGVDFCGYWCGAHQSEVPISEARSGTGRVAINPKASANWRPHGEPYHKLLLFRGPRL